MPVFGPVLFASPETLLTQNAATGQQEVIHRTASEAEHKTLTSGWKLNTLTSVGQYQQHETNPARSATHVVCLWINSSRGCFGPVESGQSIAILTGNLKAVPNGARGNDIAFVRLPFEWTLWQWLAERACRRTEIKT
jgi:hypothetical protein